MHIHSNTPLNLLFAVKQLYIKDGYDGCSLSVVTVEIFSTDEWFNCVFECFVLAAECWCVSEVFVCCWSADRHTKLRVSMLRDWYWCLTWATFNELNLRLSATSATDTQCMCCRDFFPFKKDENNCWQSVQLWNEGFSNVTWM